MLWAQGFPAIAHTLRPGRGRSYPGDRETEPLKEGVAPASPPGDTGALAAGPRPLQAYFRYRYRHRPHRCRPPARSEECLLRWRKVSSARPVASSDPVQDDRGCGGKDDDHATGGRRRLPGQRPHRRADTLCILSDAITSRSRSKLYLPVCRNIPGIASPSGARQCVGIMEGTCTGPQVSARPLSSRSPEPDKDNLHSSPPRRAPQNPGNDFSIPTGSRIAIHRPQD